MPEPHPGAHAPAPGFRLGINLYFGNLQINGSDWAHILSLN